MIDVFEIFSSKAKVRILKTLFCHIEAIPLRHIAYLSDLPVYSVQLAIQSLLRDQLIVESAYGNTRCFVINRHAVVYPLLDGFFKAEAAFQLKIKAKQYHPKAKQVLRFSDSAWRFFRHIPGGY